MASKVERITVKCNCGKVLYWWKLKSAGVQKVPADFTECDCDEEGPEENHGHQLDCAGSGYELELKNCPHCKTTLAERR